ncbi:MAG: EthD family reductase [Chloroflexota bacterium]
MKLVALYSHPADVDAFEAEYANHIKLVDKIPGLQSTRLTRFSRTLSGGDGYYLMAEMIFPDKDTFKSAMKSPEMAETGKDANRFASDILTLMIASEG